MAGAYTVTANSLNIRAGAGTDKRIIGNVPKGKKVTCYGYYTTVNDEWYLITYKDITGFVSSKYLEK